MYKDIKREPRLNDNHTTIPNFELDILVLYDDTGNSVRCFDVPAFQTIIISVVSRIATDKRRFHARTLSATYHCPVTCVSHLQYVQTYSTNTKTVRYFRLSPRCKWDLRSFGILRSVVAYRHIGTTYRSSLQESSSPRRTLYLWRWDRYVVPKRR